MSPYVKICGLRKAEDARLACELGADAIGFVNYAKSPRHVTPEEVRRCCAGLPPSLQKVLVCVNASRDEILPYLNAGCNVVQLHGQETSEFARSLPCEVWLALRLGQASDGLRARDFPCSRVICDSAPHHAELPGGTGETGDWQLARDFTAESPLPVLLAGGLHIGNVRQALLHVGAAGIDLSSGVESSPGIKDPAKIAAFLRLLKV
jgi:phosphoribosylanthranilate isomerase